MVEVVRSCCFKLNLGNYQSMDFFCSQKAQCLPDEVDLVSTDLYEWCFQEGDGSSERSAPKAGAESGEERGMSFIVKAPDEEFPQPLPEGTFLGGVPGR